MTYSEWARELVKTRPRLAGAYVMALGVSCFGILYVLGRLGGLWYFAFVAAFCILFGAWMILVGDVASRPRKPVWFKQGVIVIVCIAFTVTAQVWGPRLLRVIAR